MFKKFNQKIKAFMTGKSGFSLVELIVVIAIMAVMAAVLAPALLGYVERSRAQKDDSALSEVVNSVQLSLADQDVYDEMLKYSAEQYSCYVDSDSPDDANKVDIKAGKYYMYNDNERQLDETVYRLDGVMRGVTITFAPDTAASNSATLDLIKGHVNKYLPSGKKTYGGLTGANASPKLADIPESELYNSLRATIGDKINISSQTYRNSEYTIFISMGTTGGQEAAAQDAIKVWGQFSGTNLPEGSSIAANGSNPGTSAGSNEFKEPTTGDQSIVAGSATFGQRLADACLAEECECFFGIHEYINIEPITLTWDELKAGKDADKYCYDASVIGDTEIGEKAFYECGGITSVVIPNGVTAIDHAAFNSCNLLTNVTLPNSITSIGVYAFGGCNNLANVAIPESVTSIGDKAFIGCTSFTNVIIPNNVTSIGEHAFQYCDNIVSITIPESVTSIGAHAFNECEFSAITYLGTMEQWKTINLASDWDYNCKVTQIVCSDGIINLE